MPTQIGQFPTLARMIYRGDVREADVISVRRISPDDLAPGQVRLLRQGRAAGRHQVLRRQRPARGPGRGPGGRRIHRHPPALDAARHGQVSPGATIVSATGQLAWNTAGKGCFTVNTPGTKAVVGFAEGRRLALGDVTITPGCPYASIVLTAADKGATLAGAKRAILSAVARNCNTGFKYFAVDHKISTTARPRSCWSR